MQYLRQAAEAVTAEAGIWRLWDPPTDVPRASEIHAAMYATNSDTKTADEQAEELKKINRNLERPLSEFEEGKENPLFEALKPPRTGHHRDQRTKDDQKAKEDQKAKQALMQAHSKTGPPIGSGASSSNRALTSIRQGTKRSAGAPAVTRQH